MLRALAIALLLFPAAALAQAAPAERPVLSLSGATFRPLPIAVAPPLFAAESASRPAGAEMDEALLQDLTVSGLFEVLDRKSFLADAKEGVAAADIKFSRWQDVGAEALVKYVVTGAEPVSVEFRLYNAVTGKEELRKSYTGAADEARRFAHQFADEVFTFYSREPSAFQTRIAFVRKVKGLKQVFVADWDGKNARQLTKGTIHLLPTWTPDGGRLAFTSYKLGSPDLFTIDLAKGGEESPLLRKGQLITGVAFSPDGKRIAFSMSEDDGNSHLWIADSTGQNLRRLTDGFGINSSPSFSPDGKQIAFVSSRNGNPQIFVVPAEGGAATRLTFQGNYNQTPDWSPRGDLIAFTARDERNVFDIFTVEVATKKITRLTQDQGNNEEPSFSPNGRLIAFTSTRTGKSHLFVMSADGNSQRQMTFGDEQVFTPAWGPFGK